jgi:MFS family permease
MMLFPHYQSVGREELHLPLKQLIWWLILQNLGTGFFSFVAGPLADRFGNRLVLRILMLGLCAAPLLTLALVAWGEDGTHYFDGVFLLVGLTPITFKTLQNYTLEVCPPEDHSRYLSAVSLCMATPIVLSPLMGWGIEWWGFAPVFWGITALIFCGWIATFLLNEPRERVAVLPPLDSELG